MSRFCKYLIIGVMAIVIAVSINLFSNPHDLPVQATIHSLSSYQNAGYTTDAIDLMATSDEFPLILVQVSSDELIEQGRIAYREGRYSDALMVWQEAYDQLSEENRLQRAMTLSNLALAHKELGLLSEANNLIQEAQETLLPGIDPQEGVLQAFDILDRDRLKTLAQILNTQGSIKLAQGQTRVALMRWTNAETVYVQINSPTGRTQSLMNQAVALRILGYYSEARTKLKAVEEILNDYPDPISHSFLLRNLGEIRRLIGEFEKSIADLRKSLKVATYSGSLVEELSARISLGNTLQAFAQQEETFYERSGNLDAAVKSEDWYQAALDEYSQVSQGFNQLENPTESMLVIQAKLNRLRILAHRQKWIIDLEPRFDSFSVLDEAFTERISKQFWGEVPSLWRETLSLIEVQPPSRSSVLARINLVQSLFSFPVVCDSEVCPLIRNQDILGILVDALKGAQNLGDKKAEAYALGYLGHLYEKEGRSDDAEVFTKLAIQASQEHEVYQWEWQLGRLKHNENQIQDAIDAYDLAFESVKALREDLLFMDTDLQFDFRERVEPLYRQYIDLLIPETDQFVTTEQKNKAKEVIVDLRLAELENYLACNLINPADFGDFASIDEILNSEQHTAVIYPIILNDRLEVLLKQPNSPIYRYPSLFHSKKEIEQTLQTPRYELEQAYFSSVRGKTAAEEVYSWLIEPVKEQLELNRIHTLVFVLDGAFRNVPMAALYDHKNEQYLIEQYALATTFGDQQLPQKNSSTRFRALLGGLSKDPDEQGFGPLNHVSTEIQSIAEIVRNSKTLENESFTRDVLNFEISTAPYNLVHLATHGVFGFRRIETFLLSAKSLTDAEYGYTFKAEAINLNDMDAILRTRNQVPIDLLVLSACETATGDDREVLGLAGVAVQAGARSTVASLWSIDDSSTAVLMKHFYQELVESKLTKAEALQKALRELIDNPAYKPSDWAPFILVGDWR